MQKDERILVDTMEFDRMLKEVKAEFGSGFTKNYREMPEGEFLREISECLERWTFIRRDEKEKTVTVYPSAGKMAGHYPKDYTGGSQDE